jgi:hypothetical protein
MLHLEIHDSIRQPEVVRAGHEVTVRFQITTDPRQIPGLTEAELDQVVSLWAQDAAERAIVVTDAGTMIVRPRLPMDDHV